MQIDLSKYFYGNWWVFQLGQSHLIKVFKLRTPVVKDSLSRYNGAQLICNWSWSEVKMQKYMVTLKEPWLFFFQIQNVSTWFPTGSLSQHLIYYQKPIGEYLCCYSCSIEIILKGYFMWQEEQMSPLWCLIADVTQHVYPASYFLHPWTITHHGHLDLITDQQLYLL